MCVCIYICIALRINFHTGSPQVAVVTTKEEWKTYYLASRWGSEHPQIRRCCGSFQPRQMAANERSFGAPSARWVRIAMTGT